MPSDRRRRPMPALILALLAGCGQPRQPGGAGDEALDGLPPSLQALLPAGLVLLHREQGDEPGGYELWLVRSDLGRWLDFPPDLAGLERHDLPPSVLLGLLGSKAPGLEVGTPAEDVCRFTHWEAGADDLRVREVLTDRGWFASLERIRH